jgi:hypothetical protein
LKNLTVPVFAIGKLLSPWLPAVGPTARRPGRTFADRKRRRPTGLGHSTTSREALPAATGVERQSPATE